VGERAGSTTESRIFHTPEFKLIFDFKEERENSASGFRNFNSIANVLITYSRLCVKNDNGSTVHCIRLMNALTSGGNKVLPSPCVSAFMCSLTVLVFLSLCIRAG